MQGEISEGKKYRFYYHYYKKYNEMSVHFKGQCIRVKYVKTKGVDTENKYYDVQPYLRVLGWCNNVKIEGDTAIIS